MERAASMTFACATGDYQPGWLTLCPAAERWMLFSMLGTAGRSRDERARHMLAAGPWPQDEEDALARVQSVIAYLRQ